MSDPTREELTPETVKARWLAGHRVPASWGLDYMRSAKEERSAAFDHWLAGIVRAAKAEALREAAATSDPDHDTEVALGGSAYVRDWLNARAAILDTANSEKTER